MSEVLLRAEGLTRVYRRGRLEVHALRGVSLDVTRGEFLCIMGPPGAGKSTLLHLLGLLDAPTSGRLVVSGQDVSHLTPEQQADFRLRSLGFVFQFLNLLRELTALENVMLPMLLVGRSIDRSRERPEALLDMVGLAHRLHHRPGELSGGQQQRVAIARALANEPMLVLADEPTGNLDSMTSAVVRDLLCGLNRDHHQSVVVVSHEKEWAEAAGRVIQLRDGRIVS